MGRSDQVAEMVSGDAKLFPKLITGLWSAEALARFVACSFVPFYSRSGLDFALAFFRQLIDSSQCAELRFVPDERAVELVRGYAA